MDHHLDVLKASLSLLLLSLSKIEALMCPSKVTDAFGVCQVVLQDWVKHPNVIGGSFFGWSIQHYTKLLKADVELQVCMYIISGNHVHPASLQLWQKLLSLQIPAQNRKIAEAWCKCVEIVIKHRVHEVCTRI